jgi:hypothetical protein
MKNLTNYCKTFCLQIFIISLLLIAQQQTAQAQKLEYWTLFNGDLIFEEYLVARNPDEYTITLSVRYRGEYNNKYCLISQRKIKSPSPQDCQVLSVCSDTTYLEKGDNLDLITYKVRRGVEILYLRPVYDPIKQWAVKQVEAWK